MLKVFDNIFYIGIGGIGMSALARYCSKIGKNVAGYDRVKTDLTKTLVKEGIPIHYSDSISNIPTQFVKKIKSTLVVFTPAIPNDNKELDWFINNNYKVIKRADLLGEITKNYLTIAIAGTHGKTTTTAMIAYLLKAANIPCVAFIGGISNNFSSNMLFDSKAEIAVVEADEYDKSFLKLNPDIAIVTSIDADHLDIYGTKQYLIHAFNQFVARVPKNGNLIAYSGLPLDRIPDYTYGSEFATSLAKNITIANGQYHFDALIQDKLISNIELKVPGRYNINNGLAALTVGKIIGIEEDKLKVGLSGFQGVKRRFTYHVNSPDLVYIDDYAHHPTEIESCILAIRELYPEKYLLGIFQPHLFTRTRDYAQEFADALGNLDQVILLPIYPARELPITGVTSNLICDKVKKTIKSTIHSKVSLLLEMEKIENGIILTLGAGDIDDMAPKITKILQNKIKNIGA